MSKNDYLVEKLQQLDDEAFVEVVDKVSDRSAKTEVKYKDELIHITEIEDDIKKVHDDWGKPGGLSTGYKLLDEKIGGLKKGEVTLIGGETSNGKSALATNIAVNVAKNHGVLFITLEMLQAEIGSRIMHTNDGSIKDLNLMFQAEYRIDYKDLEPLMKKGREMGDVELVVLDYMQYLGRGMTLDEVARMSKEFKSLALRYEVPFIVIVSLRKGSAEAKYRRKWVDIEIEDFMGTGAIGYDCDIGLIASRKDQKNEFQEDKLFVKILKTRNNKLDWNDRYIELDWDQTKITESWQSTSKEKPASKPKPKQGKFIEA